MVFFESLKVALLQYFAAPDLLYANDITDYSDCVFCSQPPILITNLCKPHYPENLCKPCKLQITYPKIDRKLTGVIQKEKPTSC